MRKYDRKLERKLHKEFVDAAIADTFKFFSRVPNGRFVRPIPVDGPNDQNDDISGQNMLWGFLTKFSNSQLDDLKRIKMLREVPYADLSEMPMRFGEAKYGRLMETVFDFPFRGMTIRITWWCGQLANNFLDDLLDRKLHVSSYGMDIIHSDGKRMPRGELTPDDVRGVLDALAKELFAALGDLEKKRNSERESLKLGLGAKK